MTQPAPEPPNVTASNSRNPAWPDDEGPVSDFKPMDAEAARRWRQANPPLPLWRVYAAQVLVAVAMTALVAVFGGGDGRLVRSVAYGAVAVLVPAYLFTRVTQRQSTRPMRAGAALATLMVWEGVKIALTVALLLAAPKLVAPLSWWALVIGFVVTIKAGWVALWLLSARRKSLAPHDVM